uniref:Uncharacterized protein n=1 Tax=Rhizophora mucronata TaxID=61149 RepID=A0A2P2LME0_RHIMU
MLRSDCSFTGSLLLFSLYFGLVGCVMSTSLLFNFLLVELDLSSTILKSCFFSPALFIRNMIFSTYILISQTLSDD